MANKNIISNGAQDDANFSTQQVLALIESTDEFPVDFDAAWQWIGYKRKDIAKESLTKNFTKGVDYEVGFSGLNRKTPSGGRSSESIVLTTDCFKAWSMMAGTDKGKQIRQYFIQCEKELKALKQSQPAPRRGIGAYSQRVSEGIKNAKNIPDGYWSVLLESSKLLVYVEDELGLPVDRADLLDGSVGIRWASYREGKRWAGDRVKYKYTFPDGRTVSPWAYGNSELLEFRRWLDNDYRPNALPGYLHAKYGVLVKV